MSSGRTSSAYSSLYASPEQPDVRTPNRNPTPLPRLARCAATCFAALGVSLTASMSVRSRLLWLRYGNGRLGVARLVIGNGRLDRVLRENRAVDLHRRQRELFRDLRVLDRCMPLCASQAN